MPLIQSFFGVSTPPPVQAPAIVSPQPVRLIGRPTAIEAAAQAAARADAQEKALDNLCAEAAQIVQRPPPKPWQMSDASLMVHAGNRHMPLSRRELAGMRPDATLRLADIDGLLGQAQAAGVDLPFQVWSQLIQSALDDLATMVTRLTLAPELNTQGRVRVRRNWLYVPTGAVPAACYQEWLMGLARFFAARRPLFAALAAAQTRTLGLAQEGLGNAALAQYFLGLHRDWRRQAMGDAPTTRSRPRSSTVPLLPTIYEEARPTSRRLNSEPAANGPQPMPLA